ncbi:MAG TPA: hypothetical protein VNT55_03340 [Baekduia sp.]|nr:hypothetical protein [Baekduia sp.]
MLAHIAGVPVEETLLGFAPLGVAGVTAVTAYVAGRVRAALRRIGTTRRDPL